MASTHFILLLLLVPCIAANTDQKDSTIEELKKTVEVFKDSITYLLKERTKMQGQLENVNVTEEDVKNSVEQVLHLLHKEDEKLNEEIETRKHDQEKLSQQIIQLSQEEDKKLNDEIQTRKHDLGKLSQRGGAVQMVVMKQSNDIGLLFTKMNEIKDIKNGMAQLVKHIKDSATRSEKHWRELKEELNKRMDEEKENAANEMSKVNKAVSAMFKTLYGMIKPLMTKP